MLLAETPPPLTHPPQTDDEHDSVHAHPEPVGVLGGSRPSGRALEQGGLAGIASKVDAATRPPSKVSHSADPHEYDFWVRARSLARSPFTRPVASLSPHISGSGECGPRRAGHAVGVCRQGPVSRLPGAQPHIHHSGSFFILSSFFHVVLTPSHSFLGCGFVQVVIPKQGSYEEDDWEAELHDVRASLRAA